MHHIHVTQQGSPLPDHGLLPTEQFCPKSPSQSRPQLRVTMLWDKPVHWTRRGFYKVGNSTQKSCISKNKQIKQKHDKKKNKKKT